MQELSVRSHDIVTSTAVLYVMLRMLLSQAAAVKHQLHGMLNRPKVLPSVQRTACLCAVAVNCRHCSLA